MVSDKYVGIPICRPPRFRQIQVHVSRFLLFHFKALTIHVKSDSKDEKSGS